MYFWALRQFPDEMQKDSSIIELIFSILPGAVDKKNMKSEKNSYFFNLGEFVIFKHEHVVE